MSEVEVLRPAEAAVRLGVRTLVVIEAMHERRVPRVPPGSSWQHCRAGPEGPHHCAA